MVHAIGRVPSAEPVTEEEHVEPQVGRRAAEAAAPTADRDAPEDAAARHAAVDAVMSASRALVAARSASRALVAVAARSLAGTGEEVTARRRPELERLLASVPLDEQRAIAASLCRLAAAAGEPADGEWDAVARVAVRAPDGDLAAGSPARRDPPGRGRSGRGAREDRGGDTGSSRPWAIPFVVRGGALLSGFLVFRFAPEAEDHGTDAAIAAVDQNPRGMRFRAVVVKIVASATTIGSRGSGGRESPTGQIGAGFGSLLARALDLGPADSRVAVASGIGAGIGSISSAPLGGAVLAAEILYREDFDPTVLVPSLFSSIVGFSIFGAVEGCTPVFGFVSGHHFVHPLQLVWFAPFGILGMLVGDAAQAMSHAGVEGAPVVDEAGRFAGTVSVTWCAGLDPSLPIACCIDSTAPTVHVTERLDAALDALAASGDHWVCVVEAARRVVGTLAVPDLVTAHRRALTTGLRRIGELGRSEARGPFEIVVAPGSRLGGVALHDGALPRGLVVTTLERAGEAVAPGGSTILVAGDRLTVVGSATALGAFEDAVA